MPDQDIIAAVNSLSYRPPSLILSQDSNNSSLDRQWRLSEHILQDNPGQAGNGATVNKHSRNDDRPSHNALHSRDSSTSSTASTTFSQKLETPSNHRGGLNAPLSPDVMIGHMSVERPHSFSGGLSQSDLRRLQNLQTKGQPPSPIATLNRLDGPRTSPPRDNLSESWTDNGNSNKNVHTTPPRFPTLVDQPNVAAPSLQPAFNLSPSVNRNDVFTLNDEYQYSPSRSVMQANNVSGNLTNAIPMPHYDHSRVPENQYRLPLRTAVPASYAPQTMVPASSPYVYAAQPRPPTLDRTQAAFAQQPYYDMMNSSPVSAAAAMRRDQQIRGSMPDTSPVYSSTGAPHGGVEPSMARNLAGLPMLNGVNMGYMGLPTNGVFTPPPISTSPIGGNFTGFPSVGTPYYSQNAAFSGPDSLIDAMGRLNVSPTAGSVSTPHSADDEGSQAGSQGPSANNRKLGLYKTELCRSWEEKGTCRYGTKCQFAHSEGELRRVSRHPKYKTEICRTFWVSGSCPYGKRCCFIHTELPASGTPPGADGSSPPKLNGSMAETANAMNNRGRSPSNSAAGEAPPVSLLQRISAQRDGIMSPSAEALSPASYQFSKPSAASLRLDTTSLSSKTAYPLTSNPTLTTSEHQGRSMSPILPATAGPDFGRQTAARVEVVGLNGSNLVNKSQGREGNLRHSFNGTEMGLSINSPVTNGPGALTPVTPDSASADTPTGTGHQRAGSAGQWPTGSLNSRNNVQLTSPTTYMGNHVAVTEKSNNNPWGPTDMTSVTNRKRFSGTWI